MDELSTSAMRLFAENFRFVKYSYLGGTKLSHHEIGKVKLTFYAEDKRRVSQEFSGMTIVKNAKQGKSSVYEPISIIGMNFLEEKEASLFVNPSKGIAYIELS
ncbi:MAG: hypothetical protein KGH66_03935 [Candidatus Micrarchaeota archaeon]|nr:hypothetical protein [Candidatus Micrarchaeota archaeon]